MNQWKRTKVVGLALRNGPANLEGAQFPPFFVHLGRSLIEKLAALLGSTVAS